MKNFFQGNETCGTDRTMKADDKNSARIMFKYLECIYGGNTTRAQQSKSFRIMKELECTQSSVKNMAMVENATRIFFPRAEFNVEIWRKGDLDDSYVCPGTLIGLRHVITSLSCVGKGLIERIKGKNVVTNFEPMKNLFINFNITKRYDDVYGYDYGSIEKDPFQFSVKIIKVTLPIKHSISKMDSLKEIVILELEVYAPVGMRYPCIYHSYVRGDDINEKLIVYASGDKYFREGKYLWSRYKPKKKEKIIQKEFESGSNCTMMLGYNAKEFYCFTDTYSRISEDDIGAGVFLEKLEKRNEKKMKIIYLIGVIVSVSAFDPANDHIQKNWVVVKPVKGSSPIFKNLGK
uniref:Peptidase S1 domain-containing protein n=1 Tax=Parastrongyloides trichosuri TaxID=131310 RepID=A0A0N4ZXY6_PARTI